MSHNGQLERATHACEHGRSVELLEQLGHDLTDTARLPFSFWRARWNGDAAAATSETSAVLTDREAKTLAEQFPQLVTRTPTDWEARFAVDVARLSYNEEKGIEQWQWTVLIDGYPQPALVGHANADPGGDHALAAGQARAVAYAAEHGRQISADAVKARR